MSDVFDQDLSAVIANGADANLPVPDTDVPMVSRSLRLPVDVDQRIRAAAEARGIGATTLMRQFVEAGLADLDDSAVVPLAEVHRVLAALARPSRAA
jgi:predicted DNA-binding protein